jgi:threonine dehydrogenase-like Zn-dependent dehydrogenase
VLKRVLDETEGIGFDVTTEAVGKGRAIKQAIDRACKGGKALT